MQRERRKKERKNEKYSEVRRAMSMCVQVSNEMEINFFLLFQNIFFFGRGIGIKDKKCFKYKKTFNIYLS